MDKLALRSHKIRGYPIFLETEFRSYFTEGTEGALNFREESFSRSQEIFNLNKPEIYFHEKIWAGPLN